MTRRNHNKPLIYLVAGESSGDELGASLMHSLIKITNGKVQFAGVGGKKMASAGLSSLFPMNDISVMGFIEILPHLPRLIRRIKDVRNDIKKKKPTCVITIDSPEFNFRISKNIKAKDICLIHYVAPSVWAYRPNRAKKIAKFLDHLLVLFPFEAKYFEEVGLGTTFVGHPLSDTNIKNIKPNQLLKDINAKKDEFFITLLPGSRQGELKRHLSLFKKGIEPLIKNHKNLRLLIPVANTLNKQYIQREIQSWSFPVNLLFGDQNKYSAFLISKAALAVSGTVTLELAISGTPMVVVYRASPLTAAIAKRIIKLKYVSLGNILLGKKVATELLQENATPLRISNSLNELISDTPSRSYQLEEWKKIPKLLTNQESKSSSEQAADAILKQIQSMQDK